MDNVGVKPTSTSPRGALPIVEALDPVQTLGGRTGNSALTDYYPIKQGLACQAFILAGWVFLFGLPALVTHRTYGLTLHVGQVLVNPAP